MPKKWTRFSINIETDSPLANRVESIPKGLRAHVFRSLLEKAIDLAEEKGTLVYGAIIDGNFDLSYREKDEA
jgi:hypothetical protein|tara:strand:+ start:1722 stop:1937 length:216 start_codon:yes stop_codon:yes gene_type:complete